MISFREFRRTAWLLLLVVGVGCGEDHRFVGKTEGEMFTMVQDALCDLIVRCTPTDHHVTKSHCKKLFSNPEAYQQPIDDATREAIDGCLSALENASCDLADRIIKSKEETVCTEAEQYLDLDDDDN
jgi:hypothetical protein